MSETRRRISGTLIIVGFVIFFGLLAFYREPRIEWVGLLIIFLGSFVGYRSKLCPHCMKKFVGVAVKIPAYCSSCGHRFEEDSARVPQAKDQVEQE